MGKLIFDLVKGKNKLLFLFIFSFLAQAPKTFLTNKFVAHFTNNSQNLLRPCATLNFGIGVLVGTFCWVPVFLKNHCTLLSVQNNKVHNGKKYYRTIVKYIPYLQKKNHMSSKSIGQEIIFFCTVCCHTFIFRVLLRLIK